MQACRGLGGGRWWQEQHALTPVAVRAWAHCASHIRQGWSVMPSQRAQECLEEIMVFGESQTNCRLASQSISRLPVSKQDFFKPPKRVWVSPWILRKGSGMCLFWQEMETNAVGEERVVKGTKLAKKTFERIIYSWLENHTQMFPIY